MNSHQVKDFARECGADVVGVADLAFLKGIQTEPADLLEGYRRAISLGVRLAEGVLDPIKDRPTSLYQQHYLKANILLDTIAFEVSQYIQARGNKTLPIPASQVLDKENWTSYISHKAVAVAAGIGWQGKSLLVVSPDFGPRIRLVTILTDAALKSDRPLKNKCRRCSFCSEACPVGAIKNVNTISHYSNREEALDFNRCLARVLENSSRPFIESPICGVCIRVCPWGKTRRQKTNGLNHTHQVML